MRSIPVAMTWELLSHGRWTLPASLLGANLLPVLLLSALRLQGWEEQNAPSTIVLHFMLVQVSTLVFASGTFSAQGAPARLFAWPIRTTTLVASQMLPAMLVVGIETFVSGAALNALFGLNWPLWGPALFAATSIAAGQATLWLTEKSPAWLPWAFALVAAGLGVWLKSRYGDTFSQPNRFWLEVTPLEVLTMLGITALAFYIAVIGVARQRRGDLLPSFGVLAWFERTFDATPEVGQPFRTPAQAQFWFEWRQKGWPMPAAVVFGMVVGCGIWAISVHDGKELLHAFYAGGGVLSVVAMVGGMILGNTGPSDSNFGMGHFLATRPMTSAEMSRTILKVGAKSVLVTWSIWVAAFAVVWLLLLAFNAIPPGVPAEWRRLGWWYAPATLLGPWIVVGLISSLGLTGSPSFMMKLFAIFFLLIMARPLLEQHVLSYSVRQQVERAIPAALGVVFMLGTAWAFIAARRRNLITSRTAWTIIGGWAMLSGIVMFESWRHSETPMAASVLAIGLLATAAAPLATAPLALAWNRNR